ncbi:unnamed protein product [Mytilus edulis]|uniref:RING-type domain-containing protein n=1 Tax=Mytilus edulis TaxID=6550 RepID=A0A8S3R3Z6_MYTED|nr:unnamed protein product [Mytilus edulis]
MTICSICLEHLEQPVCCIPCGHLYCNQCISDWRNGHNNRCPECREPITTVQSIYLDTESIKELSVENTRLNESINDLTATIENLRQSTSNEEQVNQLQTLNAVLLSDIDQKVLELGKIKDNFGRAAITCETLKLRNDLKVQELGKMKDNYERANGTCQVLQRQNYLKAQELGKMKDNYERANGTCQVLRRQNCELNLELKRTNIRKRSTPTDRGFRRMIFLLERGVLDSIMLIEDNNVARFASVIFLIFTSVCFLYLTGCILTEWFSAKPEFLEDIVVRHLEFLSGGSAFIMSTFKTAASYVKYFIDTCIPACTNYIGMYVLETKLELTRKLTNSKMKKYFENNLEL